MASNTISLSVSLRAESRITRTTFAGVVVVVMVRRGDFLVRRISLLIEAGDIGTSLAMASIVLPWARSSNTCLRCFVMLFVIVGSV